MTDRDKSILEYISEVDELLRLSEFFGDSRVDEALGMIVKIIQKPDIPPKVVTEAIVKLQAISSLCAIQASYYKTFTVAKAGTEEYKRKNMLYSIATALDSLVAALKYLCK